MDISFKIIKQFALAFAAIFLFSVSALAQGSTDWYTPDKTEYSIASAKELEGLADLVNSCITFEGKTIYLESDIDLKDCEQWTPIGKSTECYFAGKFDGQNHTVSNMRITEAKGYFNGLFGVVYNGSINRLKLNNTDIAISQLAYERDESTPIMVGGYAGLFYGSVSMCENLSGRVELTANEATPNDSVGGIVGAAIGSSADNIYTEIRFCGNRADIKGSGACGGITAAATDVSEISYCYNRGSVTALDGAAAAGIAPSCYKSTMYCDYNSGAVISDNLNGGISANISEGSSVSCCCDFYPNNTKILCGGSYKEMRCNSSGSISVTSAAENPDIDCTPVNFDSMTAREICSLINDRTETAVYQTAVGCKYPVLWWEGILGEERLYGDVNDDGELTVIDAALMLKYLGGTVEFDEAQTKAADFDGSVSVNLLDVIALQNNHKYYNYVSIITK